MPVSKTCNRLIESITLPERIAVPEPLAGYEVEASKASDDDFLLEGSLP
jgi:hypothetical protein